MKRLLLLLMLLVALGSAVWAQLPHKVVLKSGTVLRGNLMKTDNDSCVKIKTLDGTLRSCGLDEVEEVGRLSRKERKRFSCDRYRGVFFRPEIGIGSGASVSLAMGLQIGPYYAVYWGVIGNVGWNYCSNNMMIGNRFYFSKGRRCMFMDFHMGFGQIFGKGCLIYDYQNYFHDYSQKFVRMHGMLGGGIGVTFGSMDVGLVIKMEDSIINNGFGAYLLMAYNLRRNL